MEAARTRWSDDRLDDLKQSVDVLQQAMILAVVAICTMMFAGFGRSSRSSRPTSELQP